MTLVVMIEPNHLRHFVVRPTLKKLEPHIPWTRVAENLVMLTIYVESASRDGKIQWLRQLNGGPARGIGQMEPATHDSLWKHEFLSRRRWMELAQIIQSMGHSEFVDDWEPDHDDLVLHLDYAVAMIRAKYFSSPKPLPANNPDDLAAYYKDIYNTAGGKAKVHEVARRWRHLLAMEH